MKSISLGGFVLGAFPGAAVGIGVSLINPWFLDCPAAWLLGFVLLPGALSGLWLGGRWGGGRWMFAFLGAEILGVVWMGWQPRPVVEGVKLLIVGLDGATDNIAEPLIARGEAPGLERVRRGARGVLQSMDPMFSPILWTTMATGQLPQDHGVEGFHVSSQDVQVPRFWDVAEAEGWSIGTWKWLVTYPPRQVSGFQVPAWLASGNETWPEHLSFTKELELSNRIQRQRVEASSSLVSLAITGVRYGVRAKTLLSAVGWKISERFFEVDRLTRRARLEPLRVRLDRDAFVHATWKHSPDLATLTLYSIDALSHRFWQFHEPEAFVDPPEAERVKRYGEVILDAYRQADEVVEELHKLVGENTRVVVLSDHGFVAMGAEGHNLFAPKTLRLTQRVTKEVGPVEITRLGARMVVSSSTTDLGSVEAWLEGLLDANGEPFYFVEDLSGAGQGKLGLSLKNAEVDTTRIAVDQVGGEPMADYVRLEPDFTGDHHPDGIFWATGPGVTSEELPVMSLLDVAPTLHGLMGIPPAEDLPGRVLLGEVGTGPASRNHLVGEEHWLDSVEGIDEERLRSLGYVE